jgi:hypothetical protein
MQNNEELGREDVAPLDSARQLTEMLSPVPIYILSAYLYPQCLFIFSGYPRTHRQCTAKLTWNHAKVSSIPSTQRQCHVITPPLYKLSANYRQDNAYCPPIQSTGLSFFIEIAQNPHGMFTVPIFLQRKLHVHATPAGVNVALYNVGSIHPSHAGPGGMNPPVVIRAMQWGNTV